jgi:nucleoside-diphosphate-sugar epimerase
VGTALAARLVARGDAVRLVSRSGRTLAGAEPVAADLLDPASVRDAVDEGSVVYLLAGLRYNWRVWSEQWPRIMRNVVDACSARDARLIFFDNVYMYGPVEGPMTEDTPVNPSSRKGRVRARIAADLMKAAQAGRLRACIARSADFYGARCATSVLNLLVLAPLAKGARAKWQGHPDVPHSFTYVPDCARALPLLADAEDVWAQVWHMPTAVPPPTGRELVGLAARSLGVEPRLMVLRPWMLRALGLFDRTVAELVEMLYQYTRPYVFDSSKFERRFGFQPTPYGEGIAHTASAFRQQGG